MTSEKETTTKADIEIMGDDVASEDQLPQVGQGGQGAVSHAPQADGLLGVIERMASDDRFDVSKMEALLKMRAEEEDRVRRIEREDREYAAKRAWLTSFSKVQSEIGPIVRDKSNDYTKSTYATLASIERVATPALTKHGFSTTCVAVPCDVANHIRMRLTIGHEGGHEVVYEDDFPLDSAGSQGKVNKTPIQSKGSTQTYARRYLKASALDLAFMDDDDGNRPKNIQTISADQFIKLRDRLELSQMPRAKFFTAFGYKDPANGELEQFPASRFDEAMKRLDRYISESKPKTSGGDDAERE